MYSTGQISVTIGASNKFQSDNIYKYSYVYKNTERSIREQNVFDSYIIGIEYQRKKLNLMIDLTLSTNNLRVSSLTTNQIVNDRIVKYKNYSIGYGFLGVRLSPRYILKTKEEKFDLLIGPLFQIQWKLYERESEHWDSLYHRHSYYDNWSGYSSSSVEISSSTQEFDGMSIAPQSVIMGFSINPNIYIKKLHINFNLSVGMGITTRRDNLYPKENNVYGFAELGIKFGYQIGAK